MATSGAGMGIELPIGINLDYADALGKTRMMANRISALWEDPKLSKSVMGSIFFQDPTTLRRKIAAPFNAIKQASSSTAKLMGKAFRDQFPTFRKAGKVFGTVMKHELKGLGKAISETFKPLIGVMKKIGGGMGRAGGFGRRVGGHVGRGLAFAGMLGVGGISGFLTGAYREAIGSFESQQNARLSVAPYLTGMNKRGFGNRGARFASGVKLGYNDIQAAQIQAMGARMGMGQSRQAGVASMNLMRGFGAEGLMAGAGMMRRGANLGSMQSRFGRLIAAGVKSGLDDARIGEFLQSANNYAEQQLAVTPNKSDMMSYAQQLAGLQLSGAAGFKGRYGGQHMMQFDKAIKGAQGAGQSFLMRAFGFGQGASFFDVLQRQERGVGDPRNLRAVMEQLRTEYGANKEGGLSQQALIAFRSMGMGTTHTGQALSKLMFGPKNFSEEERRRKIQEIMDGQKDNKLAPIQKRAYQAIVKAFGGPATLLATRFTQFAQQGGSFYGTKKAITGAALSSLRITAPIIKRLATPLAEAIEKFLNKNEKTFTGWINKGIDKILWVGNAIANLTKSVYGLKDAIENWSPFGSYKKKIDDQKHRPLMRSFDVSQGTAEEMIMTQGKMLGKGGESWWNKTMKGRLTRLKSRIEDKTKGWSSERRGRVEEDIQVAGSHIGISYKQVIEILQKWDVAGQTIFRKWAREGAGNVSAADRKKPSKQRKVTR